MHTRGPNRFYDLDTDAALRVILEGTSPETGDRFYAAREREEKLARLIDSALDAIIELDEGLNVTLVNSAEKTFDCAQEEIVGRRFTRFLTAGGCEKLSNLVSRLQARAQGRQHLWIPGGLDAVCSKGKAFSAEATLSASRSNRKSFYTLILRNVNERLEAERKITQLTEQTEYLKEEINQIHNFDNIIGLQAAARPARRGVRARR